jgi:hypothetical protein
VVQLRTWEAQAVPPRAPEDIPLGEEETQAAELQAYVRTATEERGRLGQTIAALRLTQACRRPQPRLHALAQLTRRPRVVGYMQSTVAAQVREAKGKRTALATGASRELVRRRLGHTCVRARHGTDQHERGRERHQ